MTVVPMVPGAGRPEPPEVLDDEERAIWREIVGAMPHHWFKTESLSLLRALVSHIVTSRELDCRLRKDRKVFTLEDLRLITGLQARETAAIAKLSAALRLTPKSQYRPVTATARSDGKRARPWEINGEN